MTGKLGNVVLTAPAAASLRDEFIRWQCRIRQRSARSQGGRPSSGMRPRIVSATGEVLSGGVTVLVVELDPHESTLLFRHHYLKTQDAAERYAKAVQILSAEYFQQPAMFSDVMTALFGGESALVLRLLETERCLLEFSENERAFRLPCAVAELPRDHAFYQATYWHNRLFNPSLPPAIRILSFTPDWTHASSRAEPEEAG